MTPLQLDALLFDGDPRATLLHLDGRSYSRNELRASASELAGLLEARGIGPQSLVVAVLPSSPASISALFGVWRAGAALAPANPRLTPRELDAMLEQLRPAAALVTPELAETVAAIAGDVPLITVDELRWADGGGAAGRNASVEAGIGLVLYTSGTTGRPKPVMLRRSTLLAAMEAVVATIRKTEASTERDRAPMPNLVPFPLYLWSGIYSVCFALTVGSPLVVLPRFEPAQFARLIRDHAIRSVVVAPAMIAALLESDLDDLAPLRFVRNGTAPLPVSLARRFHERFGVTVLNGYGQTELGGEIAGWNAGDARRYGESKLGSVGRPHPKVELRLLDDEGSEVPDGGIGEVCVKSPFAMAGYLDGADPGKFTEDGFVRTGDLGRLDEDGFLWLEGRRTDVVNRSGLKVFPDEVEEALRTAAEVVDVAVVGVPDERVGEVPWAFVVASAGADAASVAERLEALARERLASYKVPAGFSLIETLPRNDVGKVLRRQLRAQWEQIDAASIGE